MGATARDPHLLHLVLLCHTLAVAGLVSYSWADCALLMPFSVEAHGSMEFKARVPMQFQDDITFQWMYVFCIQILQPVAADFATCGIAAGTPRGDPAGPRG